MVIHPGDSVEIREDGHKYARRFIKAGEDVIKYGMPIGHATRDIAPGEHVHVHNLATNLGDALEYEYMPDADALKRIPPVADAPFFKGFRHPDGRVGVRNDIWVVPTVGCVNNLCERLADACGGIALSHPYGCSQLGADHETTANLLAALCRHPNAGGVLVVALGCENNTLESFRERLGDVSALNIRFMRAQYPGDEYARGMELIAELEANRPSERVDVPVSELVVGLKCGGSDGFSGLTANPLVGRFSDWLVARGGSAVLTEVPEMFGAETLLMRRCRSRAVFDRCVKMVNGFKDYYSRHNQPCYENPSPGNKAGGITTLEEKSLGCVQKGGRSPVEDVLDYGEHVRTRGLSLLSGPGNDLVASTVLAASGCHIVLFTTGRGTPFGTVVPTMKISTNSDLSRAKPHWIDWDAMANPDVDAFAAKILEVASGAPARNEAENAHGIAIFKDGVTL
ncbi:MAG: altronate dehydratase [Kiritimatiellae bacterium]|nr:altronate dehydratase [Kiritimatiellia bacterium]